MEELRGRERLLRFDLAEDQHRYLSRVAKRSALPLRFYAQCALQHYLNLPVVGYRIRDVKTLANIAIASLPDDTSLPEAISLLNALCAERSLSPPHVQTSRKALRRAAYLADRHFPNFAPVIRDPFSPAEDKLIEKMRLENHSLSEIAQRIGRGRSVVLRRLNYLAKRAEIQFDDK